MPAGPWEKYGGGDQAATPATSGPWAKYANPVAGPLAPPGLSSVPRPANPIPSDSDIFGPIDPNSFSSRVGQRIKQNVSLIPNALDALSPSKQISGPAQQKLQQATGGREGTQQMLYGGATSPIGKVAALTTIAPRMAYSLGKQYVQDPATAVGDIVTAAPELAELGNRPKMSAVPKPAAEIAPEAVAPDAYAQRRAQMTPEQQVQYTKNIDKVNAQLEAQQRKASVAANQQQLAGLIRDDIQKTHAQVRSSLQNESQAVRDTMAQKTITTDPITSTIDRARAELSGVPADLRVFNQIMDFMQNANAEQLSSEAWDAIAHGKAGALEDWVAQSPHAKEGPAPAIPFVDAQRQFTALGEAWSNADGNVRRVLGNVKDAYAKALQESADQAGIGPQFSKLQQGWAQYFQDWQGRGPLAKMLKTMHQNYAVPLLRGPGGDLLIQQYGRYADPQAIREFQRITQEGKQPRAPRIPPPPEPKPEAPQSTLRQRVVEHGVRLATKAAGGYLGAKVKHPIIGYGLGSEVGSEIVNRMRANRMPPSPEAYARQVMLDAKEGRLTPDEANRRIQRAGGRVGVRPLPQPQD